MIYRKSARGEVRRREGEEVAFVPLLGRHGWKSEQPRRRGAGRPLAGPRAASRGSASAGSPATRPGSWGCAGKVRNLPDGGVEIEAVALAGVLEHFKERVLEGPPGARVSGLDEEAMPVPRTGTGSTSTASPHRGLEESMDDLKQYIREVPDFPKPGIISTTSRRCSQHPLALRMTVDRFVWLFAGQAHRQGGRHRVARLHVRADRGLRPERRLRAGAQAGQAAVRDRSAQSYDLEYGTDRWRCTRTRSSRGSTS